MVAFYVLSCLVLALSVTVCSAAEDAAQRGAKPTLRPGTAEHAHQLTSENWNEMTKSGLWLVEHFSPGCE